MFERVRWCGYRANYTIHIIILARACVCVCVNVCIYKYVRGKVYNLKELYCLAKKTVSPADSNRKPGG